MRRVCDAGELYQRNALCVHKGAGMILAVFTVNATCAIEIVQLTHHIEKTVVDRAAVQLVLITDILGTHHQPYRTDDAILVDSMINSSTVQSHMIGCALWSEGCKYKRSFLHQSLRQQRAIE